MGFVASRKAEFPGGDRMRRDSGKDGRNRNPVSHQQAHLEWVVHLDIPFFPIKA